MPDKYRNYLDHASCVLRIRMLRGIILLSRACSRRWDRISSRASGFSYDLANKRASPFRSDVFGSYNETKEDKRE